MYQFFSVTRPRHAPAVRPEFCCKLRKFPHLGYNQFRAMKTACGLSAILAFTPAVLAAQPDGKPRSRVVDLGAQEAKSPTTSQNVQIRFQELMDFARDTGKPRLYLPRETAFQISRLLEENKLTEAAPLVHAQIMALGRVLPPSDSPFKNIIEREKDAPTTAQTVRQHYAHLIRLMLEVGRPIPRDKVRPIDDMLKTGNMEEAASRLHALILRLEEQPPSLEGTSSPTQDGHSLPAQEGAVLRPTSADADKTGASALYYKAMQEYADGKLDKAQKLLQSGAKLDPGNQDITKALERIGKEIPGSSGPQR